MNRTIREHYPVAALPEDLQHHVSGRHDVVLTIDLQPGGLTTADLQHPESVKSLEELFAMAMPTYKSLDEIAAHSRRMRDEWP